MQNSKRPGQKSSAFLGCFAIAFTAARMFLDVCSVSSVAHDFKLYFFCCFVFWGFWFWFMGNSSSNKAT